MRVKPAAKPRPSRWLYGLSVLVILVGTVVFLVFLSHAAGELSRQFVPMVAPGRTELYLAEPGSYIVFYEHYSVVDGREYLGDEAVPELDVTVRSRETGNAVPVVASSSGAYYSLPDRAGTAMLEFNIDAPGLYELSAAYPPEKGGPEVVLAVGRGDMRGLLGVTLVGVLLFFLSGVTAGTIAVVTFALRWKGGARR